MDKYGRVAFSMIEHDNVVYKISTTDITGLHRVQTTLDEIMGYKGILGNYETMLFTGETDEEAIDVPYPFYDLPGHSGLGVFQRYETEQEAATGHTAFVEQVLKALKGEETTWN